MCAASNICFGPVLFVRPEYICDWDMTGAQSVEYVMFDQIYMQLSCRLSDSKRLKHSWLFLWGFHSRVVSITWGFIFEKYKHDKWGPKIFLHLVLEVGSYTWFMI